MLHRKTGPLSFFVILCAIIAFTGCGTLGNSESAQQVEIQAQSVPTVAPTITPKPTPTPQLTPTPEPTTPALRTEIIEPISPVSPITTTKVSTMTLSEDSAKPIPGSEETVTVAIADLSDQTGIPADQIKLISIEAVEWSDSSLGCPQAGFMYAQVITPGYLIILEAQGQQYPYHTNLTTNVVLCEQ